MSSSPATLRQMLGRSLSAFQHMAAPVPASTSLDMDWAVFCRHVASAVQVRPGANLTEAAIALEDALLPACASSENAAAPQNDKGRDTAALLYLLAAVLEPDAKAFNNLAVLSADSGDFTNALHWVRLGLSLFPDDPTLRENLDALQS